MNAAARCLVPVVLPLALAVLCSCARPSTRLNEENSYYQQGEKLRQEQRYADAASAFLTCLRYSPGSYKAHLQLAVLYEDQLKDCPRAIIHYQQFIETCPTREEGQRAEEWLERVKRRYYQELAAAYGGGKAPGAVGAVGSAAGGTKPGPGTTVIPPTPPLPPSGGSPGAPTPGGEAPAPAVGTPATPAAGTPAATAKPPEVKPGTPAPPPAGGTAGTPAEHVVAAGDSLASIAKKHYGKESLWTLIYEANRDRLSAPEKLKIGQALRLPPAP